MNKVFLGGTCAETTWRQEIKGLLNKGIDCFDPVVKDWTPACQENEIIEKRDKCNIHLYVITAEMKGVFSIAEVIESAMTSGKITIIHIILDGFSKDQTKSLRAVCDMVTSHGGIAYIDSDLQRTARVLNNCFTV